MLSFILKCAQDEQGRHPGSHLQSTPDCLMGFIFGRKKQSEHNKHQSPGGFADCCSIKETCGAAMQKKKRKKRKQSMGLFFAPLNLEITLATEPYHCGRLLGNLGGTGMESGREINTGLSQSSPLARMTK